MTTCHFSDDFDACERPATLLLQVGWQKALVCESHAGPMAWRWIGEGAAAVTLRPHASTPRSRVDEVLDTWLDKGEQAWDDEHGHKILALHKRTPRSAPALPAASAAADDDGGVVCLSNGRCVPLGSTEITPRERAEIQLAMDTVFERLEQDGVVAPGTVAERKAKRQKRR